MKGLKLLALVLLAGTFVITSCGKKGPDMDKMASEVCDCSKDLFDLMDEQKKLSTAAEPDTDALMALMTKLGDVSTKAEACVKGLEEKYGKIDGNPELEKAAEEAMKKNCPKFAELSQMGN